MASSQKPVVRPGLIVLLVGGLALLIAGQVSSWGFAPIDVEVGWWFRVLFAIAPAVLLGWLVLRWPDGSARHPVGRILVAVPAAVAAVGCAVLGYLQFRDYLSPHWGGWLLIASQLAFLAAAVALAVGPRRWVGESLAVVVLAVTLVVGLTWWPTLSIHGATASAVRGTPAVGTRVGAVVQTGKYGFAGVFGGRPIVTRSAGCERRVEGLDPQDGSVAWSYARRTCAGTVSVTGNDRIVQLGYTVYAGGRPSLFVYLDPATGRELHPAALTDSITDWVGDYGLVFTSNPDASVAGGNVVAVIDPLKGTLRATDVVTSCPAGYSQRLAVAGGVFARVAVSGSTIALPYACVHSSGSSPYAVQEHLLLLDLAAGRPTDVRLPDSAAKDIDVETRRNDDDPVYPLVIAADGTFVAGYQDESGAPVRRLVGVDASGTIRWNTTAARASSPGPVSEFRVLDELIATATGYLAPASGDLAAYPGRSYRPTTDGVEVGSSYVTPGRLSGSTLTLLRYRSSVPTETVTVNGSALRGLAAVPGSGLFLYGTAGGLCVAGADSILLLT